MAFGLVSFMFVLFSYFEIEQVFYTDVVKEKHTTLDRPQIHKIVKACKRKTLERNIAWTLLGEQKSYMQCGYYKQVSVRKKYSSIGYRSRALGRFAAKGR